MTATSAKTGDGNLIIEQGYQDEYLGYKEKALTGEEINEIFNPEFKNIHRCMLNEYLIAYDEDGNHLGNFRSNGEELVKVTRKNISNYRGRISPRNIHQELAIDMLYNKNMTIKVLTGKFGTGKDFLMSAAALDLVEKGRFRKIVYVRNNIEVANSKPIGFLPGSYDEKLLPFAMPLADHIGGVGSLIQMIGRDVLEVVHLGFIRGRGFEDAIIIVSEAENMTKEHIQLLIGRVGERSELWINGDFKQCDAEIFKKNNGLMISIDRLKGQPEFGYVKLQKTERSKTAALADLLD